MKKFLSLVLALAMTMSLVTISAGAKDFTDADDIQYVEAVDVMSAIGVVDGDTNGNFNPAGGLTRGAAAKIICNLILGPTTAAELNADTNPYVDVDKNSTFAGYIAYCQKANIISGYADGTFKPAAPLTGYAFMKMLLGALGYDGAVEGYTGANWSINVAKQAIGIGLNDGLKTDFNGSNYVTREEAMLYAFNALQATMVTYETTITVGDVTIAGSKAENVAQTGYKNTMGNAQTLQFAEKYFPKLSAEGGFDDFERPVCTWTYDKTEVGTFVQTSMLIKEYTTEVIGKDLYDLLGKTVVDSYDIFVAIDGVETYAVDHNVFNETAINKNNKTAVGGTGVGVLTEVYQNTDASEIYICIINTYLAVAGDDYDTKKESAKFDVYNVDYDATAKEYVKADTQKETGVTVSNDDVTVDFVVEDGVYLVTMAKGGIQSVVAAETVADTALTAFKLGDSVTADAVYKYADTAMYDVDVLDQYTSSTGKINLKDITYNIYLDPYGNLIGIDKVTDDDNYVFITGVDTNGSNLSSKNNDAFAIFTDGTTANIQYNTTKSTLTIPTNPALVNTWCTYTVNNDGVYTLTEVASTIVKDSVKVAQQKTATFAGAIDKKNISLAGGTGYTYVYGNDDTVYLVAELKSIVNSARTDSVIISGVESVTVGVKNANIDGWAASTVATKYTTTTPVFAPTNDAAGGVYTLYKQNGYVIAAVVVGEDSAASKNLVYVNSDNVSMESYDKSADEWTWTREVVLNGEAVELKEVGDTLTYLNTLTKGNWYQVKYNSAGEVISVLTSATPWSLTTATGTTSTTTGDYVTNINYLTYAVNNSKDTILYTESFGTSAATANAEAPTMIGSTLYVDTVANKGFFVAEDAKIVFIQTNDGKTTTDYLNGADELEDVIDSLNQKATAKYYYTVSAILNSGAAEVVIINDGIDATYVAGDAPTGSVAALPVSTTITGLTINVPMASDDTQTVYDKAVAALVADGYTVNGVSVSGSEYTINASKGGVSGYVFTTDTTVYQKVTVAVGTTAAGYNQKVVGNNVFYMQSGTSVTITMSGGGWLGVNPTATDRLGVAGVFSVTATGNKTLTLTCNSSISVGRTVTIDF